MTAAPCVAIPPELAAPRAGASSDVHGPNALYSSHFAFVWRNLLRLGIPESALEDAAQDAFLVVHRRWHTYDAKWSSLESWLFGILIRVASTYRRTHRRRLSWLLPWQDQVHEERGISNTASPSDAFERRQALALLDRVLASMDEKKRVIFLLVDVEELTVPQAAQVLSINVNTAYFRLRVARQCFKQTLGRLQSRRHHPQGGDNP